LLQVSITIPFYFKLYYKRRKQEIFKIYLHMLKANFTKDFKSKLISTFLRVLMMTTIFIILGCKDKSELENTKTGTEEETETEIEEEEENTETGNEESGEENIENDGLASQYPGDANIREDPKVLFASDSRMDSKAG